MKVLAGVLAALILLIQYPLWLGKGGWLRAWEVDRRLSAQQGAHDMEHPFLLQHPDGPVRRTKGGGMLIHVGSIS